MRRDLQKLFSLGYHEENSKRVQTNGHVIFIENEEPVFNMLFFKLHSSFIQYSLPLTFQPFLLLNSTRLSSMTDTCEARREI